MQLSTFDELKVYFKGSNTKKTLLTLLQTSAKAF